MHIAECKCAEDLQFCHLLSYHIQQIGSSPTMEHHHTPSAFRISLIHDSSLITIFDVFIKEVHAEEDSTVP